MAPATDNIPGRLQTEVDPGQFFFTASVPRGSINGQIDAAVGQIIGLNITAELPPAPDYDIGDDFVVPPVKLKLYQEDLTNAAVQAIQSITTPSDGPQTLPTTGELPGTVDASAPLAPDDRPSLLVKNYAGDTLIFTINEQTVNVFENGEVLLDLSAGDYSYTASVPFAAANGIVELSTGQDAELSVVTNVEHNFLQTWFTPKLQ